MHALIRLGGKGLCAYKAMYAYDRCIPLNEGWSLFIGDVIITVKRDDFYRLMASCLLESVVCGHPCASSVQRELSHSLVQVV